MKKYICPLCNKKYTSETALETHLEKVHGEQLNGLSPANYLFNLRNNKTHGTCVICKAPTTFNEKTKKYNRLCEKKSCKEKYVKEFKERMRRKYGKDHMLDDPAKQQEMLEARKISGIYKFNDGTSFKYVGSYEKDFLEFLDQHLLFDSQDIISPAPLTIVYMYNGKEHFYIPDFYIPSLSLIIEIKSNTNKHYRERDKEQEFAKDKELKRSPFNYTKIYEKNYEDFVDKLNEKYWVAKYIDINNKKYKLNESAEVAADIEFINEALEPSLA